MAQLTGTTPGSDDDFGYTVAISGDTVVVGDPSGGSQSQGTAYVFVKPASGWANMTQTAELTASDASAKSNFGDAVAIDGDTVIVGADNQTVQNQSNVGEAYVYVKPASGWVDATQTATLLPRSATCSALVVRSEHPLQSLGIQWSLALPTLPAVPKDSVAPMSLSNPRGDGQI